MQGNPRCLAAWALRPRLGMYVWHSHLGGIPESVPSAEALHHCRWQLHDVALCQASWTDVTAVSGLVDLPPLTPSL